MLDNSFSKAIIAPRKAVNDDLQEATTLNPTATTLASTTAILTIVNTTSFATLAQVTATILRKINQVFIGFMSYTTKATNAGTITFSVQRDGVEIYSVTTASIAVGEGIFYDDPNIFENEPVGPHVYRVQVKHSISGSRSCGGIFVNVDSAK